jgi:hypothetical protein
MKIKHSCIVLVILLAAWNGTAKPEFNTLMMESTYEIFGSSFAGSNSVTTGTALLLSKPSIKYPGANLNLLITANHVLAGIKGETATVNLRSKDVTNAWQKTPLSFPIRNGMNELWVRGADQDIAAMFIVVPTQLQPKSEASTELLASERELRHLMIHPGQQLSCLGYPLGFEGNPAGFPILRTGTVASYPLTPITNYPTFMFNFEVFGGNSGGPVYLSSPARLYDENAAADATIDVILGIVVLDATFNETAAITGKPRSTATSVGISTVVQSQVIRDLIAALPEP